MDNLNIDEISIQDFFKNLNSNEPLKDSANELLDYEISITDEHLLKKVRNSINKWSNSIPHHSLLNLGNQIKILSCVNLPFYQLSLTSLMDIRRYYDGIRPTSSESNTSPFIKKSQNDVWEGDTDLFLQHQSDDILNDFEFVKNYEWPIYKVDSCDNCKGDGRVICSSCSGIGKIQCIRCFGAGRTSCSSCGGSGQILTSSYHNNKYETYYRNCSNCSYGRVTCYNCGGSGKIKCSNCTYGYITCKKCEGSKKLTYYQGYQNKIKNLTISDYAIHESLLNATVCKTLLDKLKLEDTFIAFRTYSKFVTKNNIPESLREYLVNKIHNLSIDTENFQQFGKQEESYKVLKQMLTIYRNVVLEVNYEFNSEKYKIWLYGPNLKPYVISSPIDKQAELMQDETMLLVTSKKYIEAYRKVQILIHMNLNLNLNVKAQNIKTKIFKKLRQQYYLGGISSSIVIASLITLYSISNLEKYYVYNLNNYLLLAAIILLILAVGFLSSKLFCKKYLLSIKNNYLRIAAPAIVVFIVGAVLITTIKIKFDKREDEKNLNYKNYTSGLSSLKEDSLQSSIRYFSQIDVQDTLYQYSADYLNYVKALRRFKDNDFIMSKSFLSDIKTNSAIYSKADSLKKQIAEIETENTKKEKKEQKKKLRK